MSSDVEAIRPRRKQPKQNMKAHNSGLLVIESTDVYFDEVHNIWRRVPSFWVGDFVSSHTYVIRSA